MSDPVTNAEVEDVLSSIRRLVSEDKRPQAAPRAPDRGADRLVLTPALRVTETAEQSASASIEEAVEGAVEEALAEEFTAPDSRRFDDVTEDHLDTDWSGDDDFDVDEFDDADFDDEDEAEAADAETAETDVADVDETDDAPSEGSLSAKIAALETAIGSIQQEWEPDDAGTDAYSGTEPPTMEWEDDASLDATGRPLRMPAQDAVEEVSFDNAADDEAPSDKGASADAAKSDGFDYHEPMAEMLEDDDMDADEPAPKPDRLAAEPAMHDAATDLDADPQDSDDTAAGFADATQDGADTLDEEALRDMVADIVRSELQGALGERITRNVRKLVRREIHRALTAQELD